MELNIPIPPDFLPSAEDVPEKPSPITNNLPAARVKFPMEAYRAVPPKIEEEDPYGAFLRFNKLFSRLRVQWSRPEAHNVTSTLRNRAEMVEWDPKSLKVVEGVTGLLTSIPRRCPGRVTESKLKSSDDPDSQSCPCSKLYGNDPNVWKGHLCPGEAVRAYQHFVRYVRELGIQPTDHVDLGMIIDIVQLHLIEDRCTENIQINGLFEDKVAAIAQKSAQVYYDRIASSAIGLKERSQGQRMKLYAALMADREKREKIRTQRTKERLDDKKTDSFANMAELLSAAHASQEQRRLPIIDGTYADNQEYEDIQNENEQDDLFG